MPGTRPGMTSVNAICPLSKHVIIVMAGRGEEALLRRLPGMTPL